MLRNGNNIIKNGDKIFQSQVVDSYLRQNDDGESRLCMSTTGLSTTDPLYIYYETPTETLKCTVTQNSENLICYFPATQETSYKRYYFCGNMEGVTSFFPTLNTYPYNGNYTGDIICTMNQFPNLETANFCQSNREVDFNQNISNRAFPQNLRTFKICDRGIAGDLITVENFENLECVDIKYTGFNTKISDIPFKNIKELDVNYANSITIDVNDMINNNPSLYRYDTYGTNAQIINGTTLDMSNIKYFHAYLPNGTRSGSMSGWTFNTGLTFFQMYTSTGLGGDLSNWDISGTQLDRFYIANYGYGNNPISGDVFFDGYPSTLRYLCLFGTEHITSMNGDFSNATDILSICGYRMCALSGDVGTWNIPSGITNFGIYISELCGDLTQLNLPNLSYVNLVRSNFTGNISGITLGSGATNIYLNDNNLSGELSTYPYEPNNLCIGGNSGITLNLSTSYAPDINNINIYGIGSISGDFQNFNTSNIGCLQLGGDGFINTDITATNFSKLDTSTLFCFGLQHANLCGDYTGFLTGSTGICRFILAYNSGFSADTTNWNTSGMCYIFANGTPHLRGALSVDAPHTIRACCTCISSNIETDFDFTNRAYWIELNDTCMTGHLSGVSMNYGIYQFMVFRNPSICGSNEFADYLFTNRKNWSRNYASINFSSIGDSPTGTYQMGDLGTWSGSEWDLTEAQINNLAAGTDYDGAGTNTPWTSKEKVWWNECAKCPGGTVLRYCLMRISL